MKLIIFLIIGVLYLINLPSVASENIEFVNNPDIPTLVGYGKGCITVQFDESAGKIDPQKNRAGVPLLGIASLDIIAEKYQITDIEPQFPGAKPIVFEGRTIDLSRDYLIKFETEVDLDEILGAFRENEHIIKSQPIGIHNFDIVPNDPEFGDQWHLNQANDHDIDAPEGWDSETGSSDIVIAILDSGIRYFHKDLGGANASYGDPAGTDGNMWINQAEKNGLSGFDDDSNGFIDDWIGWDFYSDDNDPRDQNGHGTHLAGIIAAGTNDGYGSSGVAGGWQSGTLSAEGNGVKIMALRVGDSQVNMALAAQAFYYATINGAKIINCSWPSDSSGNLDDAIAYFLANGGIIFKSAGNNNSQVPDYINGLENGAVISVAATDSLDRKANFSNYGMWVDISAPGTKIVSTYHDNQAPDTDFWSTKSGTSMASPMTAAVAALIWSHWPQWDGGQVVSWLKESCVDNIRPYLELQHSLKMGSGRINASKVKCPNDIPEEWTQTYAINISDIAVDIFQTSAGEYITLINSNDVDETIANNFNINLQKVNAYGCLEWSKSLEYSSTIDLIARQFIPTSDGGYLIVGDYGTQPDDKDIIVIKADSDGNKIWKRTYGGAYQQSGTDILETLNGDFLITGTCGNSSGDNDVLIMKIDGDNGDSLQAVRYGVYGATTAEEGQRILNAHSGGYIVMASANNESAYFLWLDDNLDTTKTVLYSVTGKYLYIKSMELTSDLGYICIGYTMQYDYPPNPAEYDIFMFKIDSDGETCWSQSYGQQGDDDRAYGVRETSEGGFIIAGEIEVSGQYEKDVILYKTNACGNLHWEQILYESGDEYPLGIIQTSENGFAFCGSNRVPYDTYGHSYIVKIPEQPSYPCGEVNGIDPISILDIIFIINYKYKGGPAPDPVNRADIDCDGDVDILDVIYLQEFKYKNGPAPCPCRL